MLRWYVILETRDETGVIVIYVCYIYVLVDENWLGISVYIWYPTGSNGTAVHDTRAFMPVYACIYIHYFLCM